MSSGRRRKGIREVAAAAGVSVGTVSNVLNSPDIVAVDTRKRVERVMHELGFVRNGLARQLREGRGSTVGAVVLDIGNPFFTEVARGIEDRLAEAGCLLTLCSTDQRPEREARYVQMLEEHGVRGLLVTPSRRDFTSLLAVQRRGVPVVLLDCPSPAEELSSVSIDDVRGGELAAAHLVSQGHRRILFLNGPAQVMQCAARSRGARRAVRQAGLDPSRHLFEVEMSRADTDRAEHTLKQILALPQRPTAIMCVSDMVALGVMRGLRKQGVKVPDDIAVVGYDDVPFAAELATSLTTVRQPTYELGHAAAEILLTEADPAVPTRPQQLVYQPELILRESA
ncbi:LacI family DNA-binding transcriptional regulator [Actinoplanes aureus]|uniref:LacI family DNA-binding transcriptional regulator n=1 Tax=Actinoplanes aureus TaxID=2792083 RepID=A0A931G2M2_9ACTN|nr:LacI family DNA-binding transcriptional regulator [Actinoplanes aureus]MBG0569233.1 LacI family DNA-binding transcriptional regulator [Actinoplanes aureus]